jgi:ribosomal protein S18 acetylase RimI-like enzyme
LRNGDLSDPYDMGVFMKFALVSRFEVDDRELSALHARAFDGDLADAQPWAARLERHALTWIGAFEADRLIGFVQVGWDGGSHAFLLDTAVDPDRQEQGIGASLVKAAAEEVTSTISISVNAASGRRMRD